MLMAHASCVWVSYRMSTRIHIVLDPEDKARYRAQAEREGKSLAAWLRDAAEDRLDAAQKGRSLRSRDALADFFQACDARESEAEPDWAEHKAALERSRVKGLDVT